MMDLRYHTHAVVLALRLEARARAGRSFIPTRLEGIGTLKLDARTGEMAVLASRRAVARICRLKSCLTRSIVLFHLLERQYPAKLVMGFRPGSDGPDGHAWVTVDGMPVGEMPGHLDGFVTIVS